jgi:hypothetical protein
LFQAAGIWRWVRGLISAKPVFLTLSASSAIVLDSYAKSVLENAKRQQKTQFYLTEATMDRHNVLLLKARRILSPILDFHPLPCQYRGLFRTISLLERVIAKLSVFYLSRKK